jgi:hypothetical protein
MAHSESYRQPRAIGDGVRLRRSDTEPHRFPRALQRRWYVSRFGESEGESQVGTRPDEPAEPQQRSRER